LLYAISMPAVIKLNNRLIQAQRLLY